jgi:hypothetical protein
VKKQRSNEVTTKIPAAISVPKFPYNETTRASARIRPGKPGRSGLRPYTKFLTGLIWCCLLLNVAEHDKLLRVAR